MLFFPICQDISLRSREIPHCQWGWTGSHPHSYFIFQQIGLPFLLFLLFLPPKEHACTHADLILSYYLPAVRLKCQALKSIFFKHQQQQHLGLCNFNLGWFPSFSFWPSRHLWTYWTYTMTSNHSWKSDSFGIMSND